MELRLFEIDSVDISIGVGPFGVAILTAAEADKDFAEAVADLRTFFSSGIFNLMDS